MRPRTRPAAQRGCKTITAAHLGHPLPLVMHEHELVARLEQLGAVGQHHHHAHQHGRRQCPARDCGQMLAHVRNRVAPDHDLDNFILRLIEDDRFRKDVIDNLMRDAKPFGVRYQVVE